MCIQHPALSKTARLQEIDEDAVARQQDDLHSGLTGKQLMRRMKSKTCSICRDTGCCHCRTYCISKLCLVHMLLLQQLCATLLDQMRGVQMHFALLSETYEFLFQLGIPGQPKNIVYNCISLLLQGLANSWRYGCLKAFQRYSAHLHIFWRSKSAIWLCFLITYSARLDKCTTGCLGKHDACRAAVDLLLACPKIRNMSCLLISASPLLGYCQIDATKPTPGRRVYEWRLNALKRRL